MNHTVHPCGGKVDLSVNRKGPVLPGQGLYGLMPTFIPAVESVCRFVFLLGTSLPKGLIVRHHLPDAFVFTLVEPKDKDPLF